MARLSMPVFVTLVCFAACGGGVEVGPGGEWPGDMPDGGSTPTEDTALPLDDTAQIEDTATVEDTAPVEDTAQVEDAPPVEDTAQVEDTAPVEDIAQGDGGSGAPVDDVSPTGDVLEDVALNAPPVAVDDLAKVPAGGSVIISVLANDSDPEGDPLGIKSVTQGAHGVVAIVSGGGVKPDALEYTTLNAAYFGLDSITYTVFDGQGNEDTATVTINILEAPAAPTLVITSPVDGEVIEGDTVTIEFEVVGCTFTTPSVNSQGCHGHKFLDGNKWWAPDGTAGHGHYTTVPFTVFPLTDGEHTVEFVLIRNDGSDAPWIPAVSDSVTFEVVGGMWEPPSVDGDIQRVQYSGSTKELLLGTTQGVYQTTDAVTEVELLYGGPDVVSLSQDAFGPETYYASGHWAEAGLANWGFVTSEDGGESWDETSLTGLVALDHLAVSPDQSGLIVAASTGQLHVSADSGATWVDYPWVKPVTGLSVAGADGPVLLVASSDGVERVVLPGVEPSLLLAGNITGLDRTPGGLAYGTAEGQISLCNTGLSDCVEVDGPSSEAVIGVLVDPDYPDVLIALTAGSEVHRSVDGGLNWELLVVGE